ncbi:MAG: ABC transporter permease [Thermoanaerobaculia bacterium]|nr:ABC transporter permease [Thermoanaerobaculia bacterium]
MPNKILTITKREYFSRIKTKGFWISTILMPVLMVAWMVLPSLILSKSKGGLHLAVVDETGRLGEGLVAAVDDLVNHPELQVVIDLEMVSPTPDLPALYESLDQRIRDEEIDAWLALTEEGVEKNVLEYHGRSVSNILTLESLERMVSRLVRQDRLVAAGYDPEVVADLTQGVDFETIRVSDKGNEADAGWGNLALAIGLFTLLYMAIIIYGNMVMHGVLEEKSNRVVEVMVSSVTPFQLMAGKLLGIGAASLTQLSIWIGSAALITAPGLVAALSLVPADVALPQLSLVVVGHFFLLFLLGYTLYSSFYALIGAAFNNPQEAQQLASFGMVLLIAPWLVFMPILNDPDSTLAVTMSLIPFFTPLIMMLRIAVKMPPAWQIALGYVLTLGLDILMVWVCARVYRVGILMYGKRPTLREILRWARYS